MLPPWPASSSPLHLVPLDTPTPCVSYHQAPSASSRRSPFLSTQIHPHSVLKSTAAVPCQQVLWSPLVLACFQPPLGYHPPFWLTLDPFLLPLLLLGKLTLFSSVLLASQASPEPRRPGPPRVQGLLQLLLTCYPHWGKRLPPGLHFPFQTLLFYVFNMFRAFTTQQAQLKALHNPSHESS
jgi:hypothetical protein